MTTVAKRKATKPSGSTRTDHRDGWSERKNWAYGLVSAALAGLIVVVIQVALGLDPGDGGAAQPSTRSLAGPQGGGTPDTGTAAEPATVADEPVISASVTYPRDECSTFVVPDDLASYGPAPDSSELGVWVRERDGATADFFAPGRGTAMIMLTVTGFDERPVTITDLTFTTTVREDAPAVGTTVANECGGPTVARYAEIDLDQQPPQITASSDTEVMWGEMSTSPLAFPYEVTSSDNENLLLIASTAGYVEWTASLSWSNGIDSGVLLIDDDGEPFRTARAAEENPYAIPAGGGEWLPL
jgi:hypothetical protein